MPTVLANGGIVALDPAQEVIAIDFPQIVVADVLRARWRTSGSPSAGTDLLADILFDGDPAEFVAVGDVFQVWLDGVLYFDTTVKFVNATINSTINGLSPCPDTEVPSNILGAVTSETVNTASIGCPPGSRNITKWRINNTTWLTSHAAITCELQQTAPSDLGSCFQEGDIRSHYVYYGNPV
ncbi:MAG: hypothetical protein U5L11_02525 [Arhodomonas sp.]|nr:hypothetical protein [Arhodomonas sp.]